MKTRMVTLFVLIITASSVVAQTNRPDVLNSAGGSHKKGYYIIDWSIGEASLINTTENSGYIVTNGFIQAFTHDPATRDNTSGFGEEEIRILPNPTRDVLEVDFRTKHQGRVLMRLVDAAGNTLFKKEFTSNGNGYIQKINMTAYRQGNYFLQVKLDPKVGSNKKTGAFKIIKLR